MIKNVLAVCLLVVSFVSLGILGYTSNTQPQEVVFALTPQQIVSDAEPEVIRDADSMSFFLAADTTSTTAAEVKDTDTVDLAPLWQTLTELIQWALLAIASVIMMWARTWFKISKDGAMNKALHEALERGVSIATNAVAVQLNRIPDPNVQNAIARAAAEYALENRKAAVDYFGLSQDKLEDLAKAYLPTPPVT